MVLLEAVTTADSSLCRLLAQLRFRPPHSQPTGISLAMGYLGAKSLCSSRADNLTTGYDNLDKPHKLGKLRNIATRGRPPAGQVPEIARASPPAI